MNSIEPFLESIKLQQLLNSLYEKIELDKEILLVYTHIKREEPYLSSLEPLQPLFKRYSLGFERCIQIWRKKCSADSLVVCNGFDPLAVLPQSNTDHTLNGLSMSSRPATPHHTTSIANGVSEKSARTKSTDNDESIYSLTNNLNISAVSPTRSPTDARRFNSHLTAAAFTAASSSLAAAVASSALQNGSATQTAVVNSNISINYSAANVTNGDELDETSASAKNQKFLSGCCARFVRPVSLESIRARFISFRG